MKRIIKLILIILIVLPLSVFADNQVINGNNFNVYQRSKEDINNKWTIGKLNIPSNYTDIYETLPSYSSPYKAGVVKQSYLDDIIDNLNYYRYLVGSPEITEKTSNDNELQTAEVVQNAYTDATGRITHYLSEDWSRPNDMSESFWTLGANANHNIISYGLANEPNFAFLDESIFDTINPQVGHRIALLMPSLNKVDYGIGYNVVYGRNTLSMNQYNNMDNSFAAYPSPGYFPKEDFAETSDWDIYLNVNDFHYMGEEYQKDVIVTIKNLETGEIETRTVEDENLVFDFICKENQGCTAYNILHIKQPTKTSKYYEGSYEVNVKNLIKKVNSEEGELVDLKYTVNFYDKFEISGADITNVDFDLNLQALFYDGEYNTELINEALEDINLNIELDNNYYYELKVNGFELAYNQRYEDFDYIAAYPNFAALPNWMRDPNNMMTGSKFLPVLGAYNENYYRFKYNDIDYETKSGEDTILSIDGLDTGLDVLDSSHELEDGAIFIWVKEKDGVFTPLENKEGEDIKYILSEDGLNLTIKNTNKDDEANYYVTALTYYEGRYNKYYFISKPLSLTVNKKAESIEFDNDVINLLIEETKKLTPTINPNDANYTLNWQSSDNTIVTVDTEGNIQGLKEGTATITVTTDNNLSTTIKVNVNQYKKGDMNHSGKIDLKDIILLIKKYLAPTQATELDISIGDMNNNNKIDLKDIILLIKEYLAN